MKWFNSVHSGYKVVASLLLALICHWLFLTINMEGLTRLMISWDCFNFSLIALIWPTILTMLPADIRKTASRQDEGRIVIFIIVIINTLASLAAVILLLSNKGSWVLDKDVETVIYISGVVLAWVLLHTIFTLRYAHLYYDDDDEVPEKEARGLIIPQEENPDYMDFAYFSFVIGMTFQVSDIQVTGRLIRRLVLLHGFLSFIFNTVIVALTINIIVNMK